MALDLQYTKMKIETKLNGGVVVWEEALEKEQGNEPAISLE